MMYISVPLTAEEKDGLIRMGQQMRRDPRQQAAIIIRLALEQAGYLQPIVPPHAAHISTGTGGGD